MNATKLQHKTRPNGQRGLWVELDMADGSTVDGVLETVDLREIEPAKQITLRFGSEARTYSRGAYTGIRVLAVLGRGYPVGAPGGRKNGE